MRKQRIVLFGTGKFEENDERNAAPNQMWLKRRI